MLWTIFLSFMGKNFDKRISKSLSSKYSPGMLAAHRKLFSRVEQSAEQKKKQDICLQNKDKNFLMM